MTVRILTGDARDVLKTLADGSVQCVVTSPPYYGLRNYQVAGQIGLEATPDEYVAQMVSLFREVRRVLRDDGCVFLNLGDSYASGGNGAGPPGSKQITNPGANLPPKKAPFGYKPKDLLMIPAQVALALRADGWFLRSDIIWAKPNPMPESCTDRPTSAHEHVFLLTKRARYFYDSDAIREEASVADWDNGTRTYGGVNKHGANVNHGDRTTGRVAGLSKVKIPGGCDQGDGAHGTIHRDGRTSAEYQEAVIKPGRNARNVWTIATAPFPEAHFATFPPELAERCILAGTSAGGACVACGAPLARIIEEGAPDEAHRRACGADATGGYNGTSTKGHAAAGVQDASAVKARILAGMVEKRTSGWRRTCKCPDGPTRRCVVLDPFGGAGTVALVADRLQCDAMLIELNPEYVAMASKRCAADAGMFAEVHAP
jgi:DNA modification methylase